MLLPASDLAETVVFCRSETSLAVLFTKRMTQINNSSPTLAATAELPLCFHRAET